MCDCAEAVADLRTAVQSLTDQVHVLVTAIDELNDQVTWRNNQMTDQHPTTFCLKSMPVDPTTDDWRINRRSEPQPSTRQPRRETLFD